MMLRDWFKGFNSSTAVRQSKKQQRSAKSARSVRSQIGRNFEQLEERETPSAVSWIGGAAGYWDVAANWSGNAVPTSAADVSISTASAAAITVRAGDVEAINSLTIAGNDTLSISGGSLSVAANSSNAGALNLTGGTLTFAAGLSNAGSIAVSPGLTMTVTGAFTQTSTGTLSMPGGGSPGNPATNLLANPDFTSPVATTNGVTMPSGWSTWGGSYLSNQYAYSGSQSVASSGSGTQLIQTFSVTPGASYTLSTYAMVPSTTPLTGSEAAYIQLIFFNSSGGQLSGYTAPNAVTVLSASTATGGPLAGSVGNQGWNHFSTTAVAPSTAATVQAILVTGTYNGTGAGSGTVYWDDAQFGPAVTGPSKLVAGSVSNSGAIVVGPTNSIATSGAFAQTSTGTLDLQLGGAPALGAFGAVKAGTATLAGTLKTDIVYGYTPATTDAFTPMTFASETGNFTNFQLAGGVGYQFQEAATFTNVALSAAPTTATTTTVNVTNVLHSSTTNMLGVNLTWWDALVPTTQTQQMVQAAGLTTYRFPGGSSSDDFHFNVAGSWGDTIPQFVQFIQSVNGTGLVTLDYGSGSPQEAAAELAYLQGSPNDTTQIGVGIQWNDTTGAWQNVNWGTVGYWAGLRGASPLATNDGLNFLRLSHPAAFTNIKYWEVGNEEYGGWEIDHHGTAGPGGVSTGAQHDPATYAAFAKQFATFAAEITTTAGVPSISIGIDSQDPTGIADNSWTKKVLTDGAAIGFVPNYISDHSYMQQPGNENDATLLNGTVTNTPSLLDWSTRYADYQALLQATVGSQAANVNVMATEFNSITTNPGKQSTSLVNGLFIAESLGSLLDSGYAGSYVWDLRNGFDTTQNNSQTLYGWRNGGDYGLLGSGGTAPTSGSYIAYPSYYAEQLASKVAQAGGKVVSVSSNYQDLNSYGVLEPNGHLELLVINANAAASLNEQFNIAGFQPSAQATFWQYGTAQDIAQSQSATGASALANFTATLNLNGSGFSYVFPSYSMTVIDLAPATTAVPTVQGPATASVGQTQTLSFTGTNAFSVSDPAATNATIDTVALRVVNGTLNVSLVGGASISAGSNGSANVTLSGTVAQLNAALATLAYVAPPSGNSDTLTVTAADGGTSSAPIATAITLMNMGPTVATPAASTPGPVTGVSTALSVVGADPRGASTLTYTWSTTGTPPAAVNFSANGTNAAQLTTATFTKSGVYTFQVKIADTVGFWTTSTVTVTVNQTLSSIVVTPSMTATPLDATDAISAAGFDQFAQAMAIQPSFAWSASNGSISSSGSFTPPTTAGSYSISAVAGQVAGSATVTVNNSPIVSIGSPSASFAAGGPIAYAVTVNDANLNAASLTVGSFTLNATGSATATLNLTGSGASRTLTLSGISGNGTLGITLAAGAVADTAGNTNDTAFVSPTFVVDNTPPTVTITSQPALYANSSVATFSVAGADASVNGVASGINYLQYKLDGGAFTTAASPITLTGLVDGAHTFQVQAVDNAGNTSTAASYNWTVDTARPTVVIGAPSASSTTGSPIAYNVTVTDANFNSATLTVNSFVLNATGTATGTLTLSGSGNTRTLTVGGITGNGTLGVTLPANAIADLAGNTNAAAVVSATFSVGTATPITVTKVVVNGGTVPIIGASENGTTVTVKTDGPSGFAVGQSVLISGVGAGYNGAFIVSQVTSGTFTFTDPTTGLANAAGGTATPAETTSGPLLGSQRSMVDSIVYTFNQAVKLGSNAFTLVVHSGGNAGGTVPTISYGSPDGGITWVVTFSGNGVVGNSIANGAYDITLNSSAVSPVAGGGALANSRTDTFYRLYGDINGDGAVNSLDQTAFNAAYRLTSTRTSFNPAFDQHDIGKVGSADLSSFIADSGIAYTGFTPTI